MDNVVTHFSDKARQTVVDLFGDPAKVEPSGTGLVVQYEGIRCCPIGLALRVDGKDDYDDRFGWGRYTPDAGRIAECLTGARYDQKSLVIRKEAAAFINGEDYRGYTAEGAVRAFRIREREEVG